MALPVGWSERLELPLIVAPMTAVSSPELARTVCEHGVIGTFPAHNSHDPIELQRWIAEATSPNGAPLAVNLVVHRSNGRLRDDIEVITEAHVELVIASVGNPQAVIGPVHEAGGLVFADVATLHHAERAIAAGVDGLVLLCAGSGGQTGWLNPFAFVRAVRERYDGTIVLAGGIADGTAIRAARALGADLAYMGTRFITTTESGAPPGYQQAVLAATADDVVLTDRYTGLPTNLLAQWLQEEPPGAPRPTGFDQADLLAHRDAWSAGHGVHACRESLHAGALIGQLRAEYDG